MYSDTSQPEGETPSLGGTPEPRIQRYFCVEDAECHGLQRISKDAKVVSQRPRTVVVAGRDVEGWIVEIEVPATDATVRIDPMSDSSRMVTE